MLRILHLSDIHFGQEKKGERIRHNDVREQLVSDLKIFLGNTKRLDLILINGDIAYSGKKTEYDDAVAWIEQLINVGRCDETAVLTVPGNHDVDIDLISLAAKGVHTNLRNTDSSIVSGVLHGYTVEKDEVNSIFPKLRTYLDFARGYNSEFDARDIPRWVRYREIKPGLRLRIIGMCSVQVSDLEDREGTMILGEKQYIFPEDNSVITLVLVHHPMPWYLDRPKAKPYVHNRSSILLTGHEHIPELNKIVALNDLERIEISAGAITDTKSEAPFEFAYNLFEVDIKQDSESSLSVTVWPKIWSPKETRFVPDVGKTGGPDCKTLSIKCGLVPVPAEPPAMHSDEISGQGTAMQRDESPDFGRLKHFFWHYLTWDQRITVLVKANMLPKSVENRLPQTIELEALLRAKDAGKLGSIWDDVMTFVPLEKRRPNPFHGEGA